MNERIPCHLQSKWHVQGMKYRAGHNYVSKPAKLNTLPPTTQCVGESIKDVGAAPLFRMPATKHMASYSRLIESELITYTTDIETQIPAEARSVTRKDLL